MFKFHNATADLQPLILGATILVLGAARTAATSANFPLAPHSRLGKPWSLVQSAFACQGGHFCGIHKSSQPNLCPPIYSDPRLCLQWILIDESKDQMGTHCRRSLTYNIVLFHAGCWTAQTPVESASVSLPRRLWVFCRAYMLAYSSGDCEGSCMPLKSESKLLSGAETDRR